MKIIMLILLILLGLAYPLQSDTLYLNNGDQINGQLLKVTSAGLIFEVRSGLFITGYKTLPIGEVIKVIDDFGKVLFADNLVKVDYLADYYNNPQSQPNHDYPKERIMTYPSWGMEINYSFIMTHLSSLSNLKIDSTLAGAGALETRQFRTVKDYYSSFQVGIFLQINPYLSIHALGFYTAGFDRSTGENNEPEKEESYYLAASEMHLTYPKYFIKPWIGLGYAHQSFTIISNFGEFDAVWNSQSNSLEYSTGLDINITSTYMLSLAWRLMTFPDKPVSESYGPDSIDLSNQVFTIGLKFLL